MARIFISYKRVDKDKVIKIKDQIEVALGEKCWIDIDGIESDAQFANVIINAINNSEVFLFMYSSAHSKITDYKNDWTIRELDFAQHKKKRIVFVNVDSSELTDWFYMLFGTMQQVDATNTQSIDKLVQDIRGWLGKISREEFSCYSVIEGNNKTTRNSELPKPIRYKHFRLCGEIIKMIRVQKGRFVMGKLFAADNLSVSDSSYPHEVRITHDYYICEIPVTQALWYYVMGEQPSRFNYNDKAPVDSVSWDDCMEFIKRLNCALGVEFRLPTEAEWEYAARGGVFSKNFIYSGGNIIDEVAWNLNNSDAMTHEVATKLPNELGLYDMSGNIWEWCSDFYSDLEDSFATDPIGPSMGTQHVYRGGCWCETDDCSVISRRPGIHDFKSFGGLGLRLAMSV